MTQARIQCGFCARTHDTKIDTKITWMCQDCDFIVYEIYEDGRVENSAMNDWVGKASYRESIPYGANGSFRPNPALQPHGIKPLVKIHTCEKCK